MSEPADPLEPGLTTGQLQDRAVRGFAWTMIHTVIAIPIGFGVNLLLARVLAPEGYGRLAFLTELIAIAGSVPAMGLTPAMIQFGSKAHAAGRKEEVAGILSSSQGFRLLVVAPLLTALVLLVVDVPWLFLVVAVAFGVWLPAFLDGGPITLFIENKSEVGAQIAMVSNIVVQTCVVASLLWFGTADSVWATRVIATAVGIGLALFAVASRYRRAVLSPRLPRHFPEGFWRFAIPTGTAGLIGSLVASRTEVIFLQWLSTPTQVGLFALAFGVSTHIFAPAQALTGPLIPAVSGLREVGPDRVALAFRRTLRASSTIASLLVAAAVPALTLLLPLLYGRDFRDAAPVLPVLGLVGGLAVSTGPVTAFVLARLSARLMLVANIVALVVDVVLAVALIPSMGLWGAVIANAAGTLTRLTVLLWSETRALRVRPASVVAALLPTVIGALGCTLARLVSGQLPVPVLAQAVVAALVAVTFLIAGMRLTRTGLTRADVAAVERALPRRLEVAGKVALSFVTQR
ncbi:oligosaccharide flippase family protein [Janibacter limosus]|uniref:Oligosaccharide flippase family protein n=1 Tax=Janibacter limosus TaxID=53458 RepID=A0AC61U1Z1_9MICO|nr:oligosaccharide flippase family protein [Janibacter limosus]UUZ44041.1 oligosaccharide flippase family protein [Janibacter limosus]